MLEPSVLMVQRLSKYLLVSFTCDDIRPGSTIPYMVKVHLLFDVPIIGRITLPLEEREEIPIPYPPVVNIETIKFEKFSLQKTVAALEVKFENKNDFE